MYASLLGISEALHMDIFHQPLRNTFFDSLVILRGLNYNEVLILITGHESVIKAQRRSKKRLKSGHRVQRRYPQALRQKDLTSIQ
jgi:hypothetical protein